MSAPRTPGVGTGVAAVLLPPLAVWLVSGIGRDFWIALALTCVFFVPGMIWAFVVLFRGGVAGARPAPPRVAPIRG